jgi:ABC-2 type transport system ATP-binding protein
MPTIEIQHISKSFASTRAVDDVSFSVDAGEIFGLLGPNGAGKTTTIRMLLDIFKPDAGKIALFGGPMDEQKKDRIGYLPEERGLYQDITLDRCLVYLASLKGVPKTDAETRLTKLLSRFDLEGVRKKKVKELSKGMQQKAQLIATLIHQPSLIIIDEPFNALDPINTQMVKDLLVEEKEHGATIIMSTHQMHQVEELCDRILLMNLGKTMLYGRLDTIRKDYTSTDIHLQTPSILPSRIKGVETMKRVNEVFLLHLEEGIAPQTVLQQLLKLDVEIEKFELALPSLDDIFIKVVTDARAKK